MTERRLMAERLKRSEMRFRDQESEERFRQITENMLDVIAQTDLLGTCQYASPSMKTVLGYDPKDMLGKSMFEYVHPDDLDNVLEIVRKALVAGTAGRFEYRYRHADGHYVWLDSSGNPLFDEKGEMIGTVLSSRDITERKQMEDAVRNSERKYRTLFEKIPEGIYQTSLEGKLMTANPALVRLLGYESEKELLAVNVERDLYVNPEDRKTWMERIQTRGEVRDAELVLKCKDGKELTVLDNAHLVHDEHANPVYYEGTLTDITERKLMENVLRESEDRYRTLFDSTNDAIFIHDMGGKFLEANQVACERLGYSREELLRMTPPDINSPEYAATAAQRVEELRKAGHSFSEIAQVRRDGIIIPTELSSRIIEYKGKPAVLSIARDITERKRMGLALKERVKELSCLYGVARSVEQSGSNIDTIMGEVVSIIPPAYAYPDIACARIVLGNQIFESAGFKESRWSQSAGIRVLGNIAGRVEVYYLEEKPRSFEGPFLKEERALIDAIAERLGRVVERKRVQDALHESEERYRDLFENSTDLIQSVNDDGRFEYVNAKWLEALGYTQEETKQLTLMDILRKDQVPHCNELFERVRNGEALDRVETVFVSKDGRVILVEGNVNGQYKNGQFVATRAIFRDITERKRAENALKESEQRYKAIFEGASDGFLAADMKTNKIVFANPKMCEMTGYSLKELLELSVPDMHPKKEVSLIIEQITKQLQGELDVAKEIPVLRKDKTVRYCDINGRVIEIEGQRCMAGIFRDVTERRQVEGMKDQFVSMVSHELRTPLTSIRASLGLLASGVIGALPEKGQRMLDIAVTNTDRLVRLINDILDSERLASGKTPMEKKQCSTAQLVKQASDVMKPMAEKAGVSLSVESQDAELWADPDRIVQALTNLISNAIKFSSKGGKICVAAERKENQMLFKIQDEGQGIPPDKLGLLFERFQQLDSSDARERGGSGLGLSISRGIIEQHNGKIWVESTVGKGSTFFFTLPLLQEALAPLQPEATTGAPSTRKVLIIEDDPDLANILAAMLERHNIQSHIVLTGGKGIALSKQMHPDLIVLDLILPDMDGSIVVEDLRKDNILRSVPLVVYTVKELDEQQRENLRLGETLFFTKSRIPPDQFEEKVVQFMKRIFENRGKTSVS